MTELSIEPQRRSLFLRFAILLLIVVVLLGLTNLAIHCLNAIVLLILLRQLSGSLLWPFLAAIIFALHPLAVG